MKKNQFGERLLGLIVAAIVLHLVWFLASILLNQSMLPTPQVVYANFPKLMEKEIEVHFLVSLGRVLAGMSIALILGFALGLLMGSFKTLNKLFDPLLYLTYPIPKMAMLPIVMLLFGLGDASKIIMIVLIVFPQVVLAVRDAVRNIPGHYYDIYRSIRATKIQQFVHITLPASMYAILSTSRISLGTAISILFFTENYGTEYGMGYYIMDAWMRLDYPSMYGAILLLSLMGFVLFLVIDFIGWLAMKWERV
ncbi:ABC transporter permease [Enterococcus sp. JM4C]|uniref:ABC transporter permease n=1 Tax=Candidatus Enterococcus huntleyi TaxID=1857217 RepID=UPI00137A5E05|nr:ABC transporter permease [Enterococcus sp. JM4C]KAF1295214.1 ABC transporter permease [Enterococcus sp. JM4C]